MMPVGPSYVGWPDYLATQPSMRTQSMWGSCPIPSILTLCCSGYIYDLSVIPPCLFYFSPLFSVVMGHFKKICLPGLFIFNSSSNIQIRSCYKIFKQKKYVKSKQTFLQSYSLPGVITIINLVCTFLNFLSG